ncbi:MAG: PQQ-binding-like beta-propeller repeat protein [bacterium]
MAPSPWDADGLQSSPVAWRRDGGSGGPALALIATLAVLASAPVSHAAPDTTWVVCRVFHDADKDGRKAPGEEGLASIRLTNGVDVYFTDSSGQVDVPVDRNISPFVILTVPAGLWPTGSFYHRVNREAHPDSADFALRDCPQTASDPVRFVHFSDTHANTEPDVPPFTDAIDAVNALASPPNCIINTGDLVERGSYADHWTCYLAQIAQSHIPVLNVVGNHDVDIPPSLDNYMTYVGPPYYSVEMGSWHFIMWNSEPGSPREAEWLVNDLNAASPTAKLALFQHLLTSETPPEVLDLWVSRGISSVFSGHWHCRQLAQRHPFIADYNQSWTVRGPIDRTARGFGIVTCGADGSIDYDMRRIGVSHRVLLVSPFDGQTVAQSSLPALLQAYDTLSHVASATLTLQGPEGPAWNVPLVAEGVSLWRGTLDLSACADGMYDANASGQFEDGTPFAAHASFAVQHQAEGPPHTGGPWPMFRRNAAGTSATPDSLPPPLRLEWVADADGMVALSSPVVAGGKVLFGVRGERTPQEAGIAAFDATTGEKLWFTRVPGGVGLAPAVAGDVVLVNAIADSAYGLSLQTGARLWAIDKHNGGYDFTAPIFDGDDAWVGGKPFVLGVHWPSGSVEWLSEWRGSSFYPFIYGAPAADTQKVYAGGFAQDWWTENAPLASFSRADGAMQIWEQFGAWRSPICSGDTVYVVGGFGGLTFDPDQKVDLRRTNGSLLARTYPHLQTETDSPALAHGVLVVSGMVDAVNGRNCGFDASTGCLLWSHDVGTELYEMTLGHRQSKSTSATPAIAADVVYVGALDGNLYALDLFTGAELWHYFLGAPIASSAAISGDFLYVGADDGHLYAFSRAVAGRPTGAPSSGGGAGRLEFERPSPNPGAATVFSWSMPRAARVTLAVYDLRGRRVRTLANGPFDAGRHQAPWDGRDDLRRMVADGVYFAKIDVDGMHAVRKLVHLRGR